MPDQPPSAAASPTPRTPNAPRRSARLAEVTARHWQLLRAIPQAPRRIGVGAMVAQLAEVGVVVHARTVQRDLERLEPLVPSLRCDRRSKPFGWYWGEEAVAPVDGPGTSLASAVLLELVDRLLAGALPPDLELAVRRRLPAASVTLARAPEHRWVRWLATIERRPDMLRVAEVRDALWTQAPHRIERQGAAEVVAPVIALTPRIRFEARLGAPVTGVRPALVLAVSEASTGVVLLTE